jgi:hypothetical protein
MVDNKKRFYLVVKILSCLMMVVCIPVLITLMIYLSELGTQHTVCIIPAGSDTCDLSSSKYKLTYEKNIIPCSISEIIVSQESMKIKRNGDLCKYDGRIPDFIKLYYITPDPFLVNFEPYGYPHVYVMLAVAIIAFLMFGAIFYTYRRKYKLEMQKSQPPVVVTPPPSIVNASFV